MPTEMLPDLASWKRSLKALSSEPLEQCPHFPAVAKRFEAWWAHDVLDRPILIGFANPDPGRPINRRLDLMTDPAAWLEAKVTDMQQRYRTSDALPSVRVDFGPVLISSLVGGLREVGSDTCWTHAFIDDEWSNAPDWSIADDNADWQLLHKLLDLAARDAAGRYLVCTPDLGGSADVLLNLRGSEAICLDVALNPDAIDSSLKRIDPSWRRAFSALYDRVLPEGAGIIHWHMLWSNVPYVIPACDLNALVGPDHFRKLLLPDIAGQAEAVGRAIFHLDGPDAAVHIDALLEVDALDAIQFTPGAGTPSALRWLDMFRKIQDRGRSLLIMVHIPDEIPMLLEELRPEGLALFIDAAVTPDKLDEIEAQVAA